MDGKQAAKKLLQERHFLWNVLKDFKPEHSGFRPFEGMMTAAQQVRHIDHTLRWFWDGAFGPGFDMDFAKFGLEMAEATSLPDEIARLSARYADLAAKLEAMSAAELEAPMPPNDILGTQPREAFLAAGAEHTAHHRGILTVYLRGLGLVPTMVYA